VCDPNSTAQEIACGYAELDASVPNTNPPPYPAITCQSSSGIATAGGIIPIGTTVCQNNVMGCTDGHSYSIDCINAGSNQLTCTCYRDGAMGVTFGTPGYSSCPYVSVVNAYCGWQLASI
jgi:hypothetical protein